MRVPFLDSPPQRVVCDLGDGFLKFAVKDEEGRVVRGGRLEADSLLWESELRTFLQTLRDDVHQRFSVVLSPPPGVFKARAVRVLTERQEPDVPISSAQEAQLFEELKTRGVGEMRRALAEETGIAEKRWEAKDAVLLSLKIDGYKVERFKGYEGRCVASSVLGVFFAPGPSVDILSEQSSIVGTGFAHWARGAAGEKDGLYVDVGERVTQAVWVSGGEPGLAEVPVGSGLFVDEVRETFGMSLQRAREFLARYGAGALSEEASARASQLVGPHASTLARRVKEAARISFPLALFGGGSILPDVQNAFERAFGTAPRVLLPRDLAAAFPRNMNTDVSFTPLAFLCQEQKS